MGRQLMGSDRWFKIIQAINRSMVEDITPQTLVDLALDKLFEVEGVDCCWIQRVDESGGKLLLLAHRGFPPGVC